MQIRRLRPLTESGIHVRHDLVMLRILRILPHSSQLLVLLVMLRLLMLLMSLLVMLLHHMRMLLGLIRMLLRL